MNRTDLAIRLREVIAVAQYDPTEAIKLLTDILKDLNDEIQEIKRKG